MINRIESAFALKTREGINARLNKLRDNNTELSSAELDFVEANFKQKTELLTYDLLWVLLLNSPKRYSLKDFCIKGIEENLHSASFVNWNINGYISQWAFQYLVYLYPDEFDTYFSKYYGLSTNVYLKMSIAECMVKRNNEIGLKLMIDMLPNIIYEHELWDSIGMYVTYKGNIDTIAYLYQKIKDNVDSEMAKVYAGLIDAISKL